MNERAIPEFGEIWEHFKGKFYITLVIAEHTETSEKIVIYTDYKSPLTKIYARPLEMFMSKVDLGKYPGAKQKYRFERVRV